MLFIKNAQTYTPESIGRKDVLLAGNKVLAIEDSISEHHLLPGTKVIDASHHLLVPGFVDSLVHITGGGGEGGFHTRTPAMDLSDATTAGITTLVGALGTDSTTRSLPDLLAKARALSHEGITCYCHTGSYQVPVTTITGSVKDDIILINEFIGVGEIAIADHRSSMPSAAELGRIAAEARVGGMLSGKKGIVSIHMGDSTDYLSLLETIIAQSDIPRTQFYPTHMNRNLGLFDAGKQWANSGGYIDLTTSTTEMDLARGEPPCSKALAELLDDNIAIEQITFSSDGHASLPIFDDNHDLVGLKVGLEESLYREVRLAVTDHGVDLATALKVITQNPAKVLGLSHKGHISTEHDADMVLLRDDDLAIDTVIARGQVMVEQAKPVIKGTFE